MPVAGVRSMDDVVAAALSQPRFTGALFSLFSGLAVLLAAVRIYGVLSCLVSQRRRKIGIRLAIGASPSAVARQLLGRGELLSGLVWHPARWERWRWRHGSPDSCTV